MALKCCCSGHCDSSLELILYSILCFSFTGIFHQGQWSSRKERVALDLFCVELNVSHLMTSSHL